MDFESFLFRGECDSLDFKRDQYPFPKNDKDTKSELLKDILAMANAWRNETAYILIGVQNNGFPKTVVGCEDHFDDAILQQFVTEKTNRPVRFSYYESTIQSRPVGVIEIPIQERPVFLHRRYGVVEANTVYVRRGSATAIASPDEIAAMGVSGSDETGGNLSLSFAEVESRKLLGNQTTIEPIVVDLGPIENIPDFAPNHSHDGSLVGMMSMAIGDRPNPDFYREYISRFERESLVTKVALTVTNDGSRSSDKIRVEFKVDDKNRDWEFFQLREVKQKAPPRYFRSYGPSLDHDFFPVRSVNEPFSSFEYLHGVWHLVFEFGYLQAGRTLWPSLKFYVGARKTGSIQLVGKVLADAVKPSEATPLVIHSKVSQSALTLNEILDLIDKHDDSSDEQP
jgi:hypothetical protein